MVFIKVKDFKSRQIWILIIVIVNTYIGLFICQALY